MRYALLAPGCIPLKKLSEILDKVDSNTGFCPKDCFFLIYYRDTHAFFLRCYDQIEELRMNTEESFGEPLKPEGDLMNWYSWFAFEETSKILADEIGILEFIEL